MAAAQTTSFIEHVRELRRRVIWSVLFVGAGGMVGYFLYSVLLEILQRPYGKELYYTTPTGALGFLIKVCFAFGFIVGLPMITYQLLAFIAPATSKATRKMVVLYVFSSVLLAVSGILFAYFISMPAALHFLTTFGDVSTVKPLITADEYFNFVLAYIAGFALLFQIPLLVSGINRITPLKPTTLLKASKYVFLGGFIVAAVLTPTPDPFNQAIMAIPVVVLYFISIVIVTLRNRRLKLSAPSANTLEPAPTTRQVSFQPLAQSARALHPVIRRPAQSKPQFSRRSISDVLPAAPTARKKQVPSGLRKVTTKPILKQPYPSKLITDFR